MNKQVILDQLNNLINSEYEYVIDTIKGKINNINEFITKIDDEIQKTISELNVKEGRLGRLNILTDVKQKLNSMLKELISEYREVIKNKIDVGKFILTKEDVVNAQLNTLSEKEQYMKEFISYLDLIARRDKQKQKIISEIIFELANLGINSELNKK